MNSHLLKVLFDKFDYYITDPLWKDIPLNKELMAIVKTKAFQKLNRIKQNGPTYHVYPGAVHTRYNHCLGVYNLGRLIIITLLRDSEPPFTEEGIMSFLVACLLHDLGHFPYAHALKELAIEEHEALATYIIKRDKELNEAVLATGADIEMVCAIIDTERKTNDPETKLYRKILSGSLDPDKLDYLNRDAFFTGVPYGEQETERIIHALAYKDGNLIIRPKVLSCVEHLLFSKYMMYKNVYWNQDVRSATAMVKKALLEAINAKVIKEDDLYYLDDEEFALIPKTHNFKPLCLIDKERDGEIFTCTYEKDFDKNSLIETECSDIYTRREFENKVYEKLKVIYPQLEYYEVIVDIPEPIKFESNIAIFGTSGQIIPFNQIDPLFNKDIKDLFSKSLRKVRIFTPSFVSKTVVEEVINNGF